jgi:hypothetical protein
MAGHPQYKVSTVQKSDTWLHRGLLGREKKEKENFKDTTPFRNELQNNIKKKPKIIF